MSNQIRYQILGRILQIRRDGCPTAAAARLPSSPLAPCFSLAPRIVSYFCLASSLPRYLTRLYPSLPACVDTLTPFDPRSKQPPPGWSGEHDGHTGRKPISTPPRLSFIPTLPPIPIPTKSRSTGPPPPPTWQHQQQTLLPSQHPHHLQHQRQPPASKPNSPAPYHRPFLSSSHPLKTTTQLTSL